MVFSENGNNLTRVAYQHIRAKLWRGEFRIGSKLPEIALAKEIGVSRTPVREAVSQLESEGFVVQIPNVGVFVRSMDREELNELFHFRTHLECYAMDLAVSRAKPALLKRLDRLCADMFKLIRQYRKSAHPAPPPPKKMSQWHLIDAEFHETLLAAAENRWVSRISSNMHLVSRIFLPGRRHAGNEDPLVRLVRIWRDHRRITRAIRSKNPALGRRELATHIERGRLEAIAFAEWMESQIAAKPRTRKDLPAETAEMLADLRKLRKHTG